MAILTTLLYIVFVLSAIVLIVVILLQEGRGGGLGQALGEHGQQTIGVGAKGINTFTGYTAAVFLVTALVLHSLNRGADAGSVLESSGSVLSEEFTPTGVGTPPPPPAGGGSAPPPPKKDG